jgi:vacuolar protein sorting-associated protein 13A/C
MGLVFTLDYLDFAGRAGPLKVDDLKHQIAMVKSIEGYPIGSLAVQTVIGGRDSRLVVKLGEVKFGESSSSLLSGVQKTMWERDLVRMRIRWSELNLTLCETRPVHTNEGTGSAKVLLGAVVDRIKHPGTPKTQTEEANDKQGRTKDPVCTISLTQFTVDWQRIFKEEPQEKRSVNRHQLLSPERSQLSLIIHNFQVLDRTPNSPYPVVQD